MRKLLLATTALAALVVTPALAADMAAPVYKAPPPPAPIFSWTGFYIGLNGGYGWGHDPVTFSPAVK
jgi:outer membrane immunogenic protein